MAAILFRGALGRAAFALAVLVAGCVSPGGGGSSRVALFQGDMIAQPPAGYCVDQGASAAQGGGAVVLMGRCSGDTAAVPALITLSVGEPGSSAVLQSGAKALSDYFRSPAGRAALARDGKAGSVRVQQTSVVDGALVLRVVDRAVGDYWRVIFGLRGRLVTISVRADDPAQGRRIVDLAMAAMRQANPATSE